MAIEPVIADFYELINYWHKTCYILGCSNISHEKGVQQLCQN
jgi:hypothetical protein